MKEILSEATLDGLLKENIFLRGCHFTETGR